MNLTLLACLSQPVALTQETRALRLQHEEAAGLASQRSQVCACLAWLLADVAVSCLVQCLAHKLLFPHCGVWEDSEGVKDRTVWGAGTCGEHQGLTEFTARLHASCPGGHHGCFPVWEAPRGSVLLAEC